MSDTLNKILIIINKYNGISLDKMTPNRVIGPDLNLNSLDSVELIMEIESTFNVDIDDEYFLRPVTIKDIVAIIDKQI